MVSGAISAMQGTQGRRGGVTAAELQRQGTQQRGLEGNGGPSVWEMWGSRKRPAVLLCWDEDRRRPQREHARHRQGPFKPPASFVDAVVPASWNTSVPSSRGSPFYGRSR